MIRKQRWLTVAALSFGLLVGLLVVPGLATRTALLQNDALGRVGANIYDQGTPPTQLEVCGREWTLDPHAHHFSLAEIQTFFGAPPVVVSPWRFAPCPPGPCTRVEPRTSCDMVVFIRIDQDAYLAYALNAIIPDPANFGPAPTAPLS